MTSCLNTKYPTNSNMFKGVVLTCTSDASIMASDTIIRIKKGIWPDGKNCTNCRYLDCPNKPECVQYMLFWPGAFILDFKKNIYAFVTNPTPTDPNAKCVDDSYGMHYDVPGGTLKHHKKTKTLDFTSYSKVTRTYKYNYSPTDSVLTLRLKNGY